MYSEFEYQIMALALARKQEGESKQDEEAKWYAVEQTPEFREWAKAHALHERNKGIVAHLEGMIKSLAIALHAKGDFPGYMAMKIKNFSVMGYDPAVALEWCKTALPTALSFDKKAFEKVAATGQLPFVSVYQQPRAQIASNLEDYIPVGEPGAMTRIENILLIAAKVVETDTGDDEPVA